MKHSELLARILILAGILLAVGAPLIFWTRTPLIHARMADTGGWNPDVLQAEAGKPLHLSLTSNDVVHGLLSINPGPIPSIARAGAD
jgi:hypothetical protein